jgi:hypothetical protein
MKLVCSHRSKWPLQPLNEQCPIKDVNKALKFGNFKGSIQEQDLLKKLVTDNIVQGFSLPLSLDKITSIPGVLLAPLNTQEQNTINEHGKIIPKNQLRLNQSRKWQSKTLVNSRVNTIKLTPCYIGRALQ